MRTSRPPASNRRKGSVPRKLNRPTFSPPMTLSNRNDGAVRSIRRKAETGVRPSPVNWRYTGMQDAEESRHLAKSSYDGR